MEKGIKENAAAFAEDSVLNRAKEILMLKDVDVQTYSALSLAYIGDAVYELMIRTMIVNKGNSQVNKMHKKSASLVKAPTQARLAKALQDQLTEEEHAVFKRGRNAKSFTSAKNASMIDYRTATGFEALIGYLYLTEKFERLFTLVKYGLEQIGEQ